ncbi:MAG: hypothetical protein U0796_04345 [Gemmatales bacterium]
MTVGRSNFVVTGNEPVRIVGDVLWLTRKVDAGDYWRYELLARQFTKDETDKLVTFWMIPKLCPFEIACTHGSEPTLVVRTAFSWHPALATLNLNVWSGLSTLLTLQNGCDYQTVFFPWFQTYRLTNEPQPTAKPLASWTVPTNYWNRSYIVGPDAKWVVLSDPPYRSRWNAVPGLEQETSSEMLFDTATGALRPLIDRQPGQKSPVRIESWGHLLAVGGFLKETNPRVYDARTGQPATWPESIPRQTTTRHDIQDQSAASKSICATGSGYYHVSWEGDGVKVVRVNEPQVPENIQLYGIQWLMGDQVAQHGSSMNRPQALAWLAKHWAWLDNWLNVHWPEPRVGVQFADYATGQQVWYLRTGRVEPLEYATKHVYIWDESNRDALGKVSDFKLQAWALPFNIYSHWWGRCVGLGVALMVLLSRLLGRKRVPAKSLTEQEA